MYIFVTSRVSVDNNGCDVVYFRTSQEVKEDPQLLGITNFVFLVKISLHLLGQRDTPFCPMYNPYDWELLVRNHLKRR